MTQTRCALNKFEESSDHSTTLPHTSYNSFGTISPPTSGSPDHDADSISDNSKKIRKKRNTYQKIDDNTRMKLLDAVKQGETLKAAAKKYGINYSSAKSILHTFRKEGRIFKKSAQERIARKKTKASSDIEMSPIYPYKQFQSLDDGSENPGYSTFNFQQHEPIILNGSLDDGNGKSHVNGLIINSFGDSLRVDSQGRPKSDNSNPGSTITLKLDSQKLHRLSNNNNINNVHMPNNGPMSAPMLESSSVPVPQRVNNSRNIQSGSWHLNLNVNVHSESVQKSNMQVNMKPETQLTYTFAPKTYDQNKAPESYYTPYSIPQHKEAAQQDSRFYNKHYNSSQEIANHPIEPQYSNEQQNYDVSYFLNSSSPAYSFPQKKAELEQHVENVQNYPSNDNMQGYRGPQDMYGKYRKDSYTSNFALPMEQGASGMMKTASLRSY